MPVHLQSPPDTLDDYLHSLSFPFVEVEQADAPDSVMLATSPIVSPAENVQTAVEEGEFVLVWPPSPDMVPEASGSRSPIPIMSLPSAPVLPPILQQPTRPEPEDPTQISDYFNDYEHHTLRERILAWGVNHLQALEALMSPLSEDGLDLDAERIESARPGAQVRFLIKPIPRRADLSPSPNVRRYIAAITSGVFGVAISDKLSDEFDRDFDEENYELAEADFGVE